MLAKKGTIVVKVNPEQKDEAVIAGKKMLTGKYYATNFRERNPILARVLDGYGEVVTGSWIICNYTYFDFSSPYLLTDHKYAIPVDSEIYAVLGSDGEVLRPVFGNLVVRLVEEKHQLELPEHLRIYEEDRGIIVKGNNHFKKDDFVLFLYKANLEMVYIWEGFEKRFVRIHEDEIVGIVK